jgi:4-oxalocrotonate tautomerase
MPILNVTVSGQPDAALSAIIAGELSAATQVHLRKDAALTAVVVNFTAPEFWIVGGSSLAALGLKSFWLDIKVTAGTNTKAEMATYIEVVFQVMGRVLGALHATSYIVVHEVPAAAWGYAGQTQEFRFVAGRMKSAGDSSEAR